MHMSTDNTPRDAAATELQAGPNHETPCGIPFNSRADRASDDWILAWGGPMKRGVPIHPLWD